MIINCLAKYCLADCTELMGNGGTSMYVSLNWLVWIVVERIIWE